MFEGKNQPKPQFIAPNQPSVLDQARQAKANAKFKMIEANALRISEMLKQAIIEADIEVGDYKVLMEAVVDKMATIINNTINSQRLNNVLQPDEEAKVESEVGVPENNQEENGEPEANN